MSSDADPIGPVSESRPGEPLPASGWTIVLAIKRFAVAKSRLALPPDRRRRLVAAMAVDTVAAVLAARSVRAAIVVTDEPKAKALLGGLGAHLIDDEPADGLNQALMRGIAAVQSDRLAGPVRIATLTSDLPALQPSALNMVLDGLDRLDGTAVIADHSGTGTTLLAGRDGHRLRPEYGPGSFARHVDGGARDLTALAGPRLRTDVDTVEDLRLASRLGLGPASALLLRQWGWS